MTTQTKRNSVEDLKKKAEFALQDPYIVRVVSEVPDNQQGKVNLTAAYNSVFQHVMTETNDRQQATKLARSARFLAMLRRDFKEEFEELVENILKQPGARKTNPKCFYEQSFELPYNTLIETKETFRDRDYSRGVRRTISFHAGGIGHAIYGCGPGNYGDTPLLLNALEFAKKIFFDLVNSPDLKVDEDLAREMMLGFERIESSNQNLSILDRHCKSKFE